ncbi:IclR family transcriptional regulator [Streptomyces sp. NPDC048301]|uniref:IclR family transcriptional regulator n=1 Tax=Streptomyces sp. NPDC048301 TaxID=3155631 RepID=UPI0034351946
MADTLHSVQQALRILTMLQETEELRLSDVAARLGVGKSSAHRLLATLRESRFVDQTPSRRYRLGPAMSGSWEAAAVEHCLEVAAPHLVRLRDRTLETVHVSTLNGTNSEFRAVSESPRMVRVASKVGESIPAHLTAAGKVMLAALTSEQLHALYPGESLPAPTERAVATRSALLAELDRVRRLGYGRNVGESEEGVAALAVPLRRPSGGPVCNLTVTGPVFRFNPEGTAELSATEEHLLAALRRCAGEIERELRH